MARYKRITVIAQKMAEDPPEIEVQARQVPRCDDYSSATEWWREMVAVAEWSGGKAYSSEEENGIELGSGSTFAYEGDFIFEKKDNFQLVYDDGAFRKNYEFMGYY